MNSGNVFQSTLLLSAVLFVLAVCCVTIAAIMPVSRAKGRVRVAASLLCGAAFPLYALSVAIPKGEAAPVVIGLLSGPLLVWVGWRKYQRDPKGRTPAAQIL